MKSRVAAVFAIAALAIHSHVAASADFRPVDSGTDRQLVIEGVIEPGDFDKFLAAIRDGQGRISTVWIYTPGGDFEEAIRIGRAMRALELASMVPTRNLFGKPQCDSKFAHPDDPSNCIAASAGFLIHIGAVRRGGSYILVHRPYYEKKHFRQLTEAQAQVEFAALQAEARTYMDEMGVNAQVQEIVLATPSDTRLVLDETTVQRFFSGDIPARQEWMIAKCARMYADDRKRLELLRNRVERSDGKDLTRQDEADFARLDELDLREQSCRNPIAENGRIAAVEKYFQIRIADRPEQPFAAWAPAANLIGRQFANLLDTDGLVERSFSESNRLERPATAHSPMLMAFDAPRSLGVVSRVAVYSPPNPTKRYEALLIEALEKAWEKPGDAQALPMTWRRDGFTATLQREHTLEGEALVLRIDDR